MKTPPAWHKEFTIGFNPQYPTYVTVYMRGATLEYPERSIFIQFNNSAGSCYCRLDSIDELHHLASEVELAASEATKKWTDLEASEKAAKIGIQAFCAASGIDPDIVDRKQLRDALRNAQDMGFIPPSVVPSASASVPPQTEVKNEP